MLRIGWSVSGKRDTPDMKNWIKSISSILAGRGRKPATAHWLLLTEITKAISIVPTTSRNPRALLLPKWLTFLVLLSKWFPPSVNLVIAL